MILKHVKNKIASVYVYSTSIVIKLSYFKLTALNTTECPDYLGGSWVENFDASMAVFLLVCSCFLSGVLLIFHDNSRDSDALTIS